MSRLDHGGPGTLEGWALGRGSASCWATEPEHWALRARPCLHRCMSGTRDTASYSALFRRTAPWARVPSPPGRPSILGDPCPPAGTSETLQVWLQMPC